MKNIKKAVSVLIALLMLVSVFSVAFTSFAATYNGFTYTTSGSSATITGYTGSSASVSVPSQISTYTVTTIADSAFSGNTTITSVTLPSTVTTVGSSAFYDCTSLKSVTLSTALTAIASSVFNGCTSLESISLPSSVTSIGSGAFAYCSSLKTVTINGSVTTVGDSAFYGCSSLQSITLPNTVTSIGDSAFAECTALTSFTFPSSLTSMGDDVFDGCVSISSYSVASGNKALKATNGVLFDSTGTYLLMYPAAKSGAYTVPSTVTTIYTKAFYNCTGITSVTVPSSVTAIGESAFCGCINLSAVSFNANITAIPASMFFGCEKLSSFTIPSTVTSIGADAFNGCSSLKSITVPSNATTLGNAVFANCSGLTTVSLPSSLLSIPTEFFANCSSLTNITIPSTVQLISDNAFDGCSSLKNITLPSSLVNIGSSAFANCVSLQSITIPNTVTLIGYLAFYNCKSITAYSVQSGNENYYATNGVLFNANNFLLCAPANISGSYSIPSGTVGISDYAFQNCSSITAITIPTSVYGIGYNAFLGCDSLANVNVTSGSEYFSSTNGVLMNVDKTTLYYVPAAKTGSYSIPEGIVNFSTDCFGSNTKLSSITIPSTIENIDITMFSFPALQNLNVASAHANYTSVDGVLYSKDKTALKFYPAGRTDKVFFIPNTTTAIDYGAFYYNENLEEVVIPDSVTNFSYVAFNPDLDITICASENSVAVKFAQAIGLDYKIYNPIKSVEYTISGATITFTVTTYADADITSVRMDGTNTVSTHTTANGDYVWILSATAPTSTKTYTFDAYSQSASAYLGLNVSLKVEVEQVVEFAYKSISHTISDETLTFTVVTTPANVDRIKVMNSENTSASLVIISRYTVDANGNYVWTASITAPTATTTYTFDARSSETGSYMGEYQNYTVEVAEPEPEPVELQFISVSGTVNGDNVTFTVTTTPADINAVKVVLASNTSSTVAQATTHTVNASGNYVWTLTFALPSETTEYRIYARDAETNQYITTTYATQTIEVTPPAEPIIKNVTHSIADGKITLTITTRPVAINRVKVMEADDLVNYVKLVSSYTVNDDGDYVWVATFTAPTSDIQYAFDVRSSETGKYLEEYAYYTVEIQEVTACVEAVSHEISGSTLTFTVTTSESVNAVKLMKAETLTLITLTSSYTAVNGKRVWTLTMTAPEATTAYTFDVLSVYTGTYIKNYYDHTVEISSQPEEEESFYKSVTHTIEDGKIIFTVITSPAEINRLKVCATSDLSTSLGVGSTYTVNADGNYVWTIKTTAPTVQTSYSFDARSSVTNKYLKEYFEYVADVTVTPEPEPDTNSIFKSASYTVSDGKLIFNVVTKAGDYNRVKVSLASNLSAYLDYVSKYTVNADGDYVWTLEVDAPATSTEYAFDVRLASTGKYAKEYFYFTADPSAATPEPDTNTIFKSATYTISDGKVTVTVVTAAGDYNRVKISLPSAITSYVKYVDKYTTNADGDYVWTLTFTAPTTVTEYALDVRLSTTSKYVKDYYYFTIDPSAATPEPDTNTIFQSATYTISGDKVTVKVVTSAGDYNRVKISLPSAITSYVKYVDKYTTNADGDYVWELTFTAPTMATEYALDVRLSTTSKYVKDYYYFTIDPSTATPTPDTNSIFKSATYTVEDGKVIVTITTASGDYNRIKLVAADALGTSLAVVSKYTVNGNGDYVWTLTFNAPATATEYALDMRIASTGKYAKEYYYFTVDPSSAPETTTVFVSASTAVSGSKITFTIVTKPAEINRIKVMLTSNQSSYVKLIDKYTVDENGNYVWTATTTAPAETTSYTFDVRSSVTNKYMKDYYEYTAVI